MLVVKRRHRDDLYCRAIAPTKNQYLKLVYHKPHDKYWITLFIKHYLHGKICDISEQFYAEESPSFCK